MKTSSTLGLGVIAAALVGGALFYGRHEETIITEAQAPEKSLGPAITSGTVERIEITVPGEKPVKLEKQDGVWYTDAAKKHRADKGAVSGIFTALDKELAGPVESSNPDSYSDYQVNETSGTHVEIYEAGKSTPAQDLIIGKEGGAAFTTYVREAHGKDVINARASLSYTFKRPEGWRDKTILEFPQDAVTKIASEGTSGTFDVAKNEAGTWKVIKPNLGDAQPTKVTPIVSTASNLRANEFVDTTAPLSDLGLNPPRQKLTITYDDKATSPAKPTNVVLLIGGKKAEGQYYAKRPDADDVYTIGEYMATTFAPEVNSLALTPPAPPAETTGTATAATTGTVETSTSSTQAAATPPPVATPAPTPVATPVATPAATESVTTSEAVAKTPAPVEPAASTTSSTAETSTTN